MNERIIELARGVSRRVRGTSALQDLETLYSKLGRELEEFRVETGGKKKTELADIVYYANQIIFVASLECGVTPEQAERIAIAKYEQRERNDLTGAPKHTGELEAVLNVSLSKGE